VTNTSDSQDTLPPVPKKEGHEDVTPTVNAYKLTEWGGGEIKKKTYPPKTEATKKVARIPGSPRAVRKQIRPTMVAFMYPCANGYPRR
jgi:hypothetical protein